MERDEHTGRGWSRNHPKLSASLVEEIRTQYRERTSTIAELALTYDFAVSTIYYLVRWDIPVRERPAVEAGIAVSILEAQRATDTLERIMAVVMDNLDDSDWNPRLRDVCMVLLAIMFDNKNNPPKLGGS